MRNLALLDALRVADPIAALAFGGDGCSGSGCFLVTYPGSGRDLRVIASTNDGWDHVSVSLPNRCPNWAEMEHVKRLFFRDDEAAMQLHVPPSDHVNFHPYCLHLWRPQHAEIPRPPARLVGAPPETVKGGAA